MNSSSLMYLMKRQTLNPMQAGDAVQDDGDEQQAGGVEASHQHAQLGECPDTEVADGERHRTERPDRRRLHDDADNREQHP